MSLYFRDRAFCVRSRGETVPHGLDACTNKQCDRYAGRKVVKLASKAGIPIGYADLLTSRCGFVSEKKDSQTEP